MKFQDIIGEIKRKNFKPVYLLTGDEPFFMDRIVEALDRNVLKKEQRDFNLSVLYGKDTNVGTILDSAKRYPMMAEKQLIIVKEAQYLKDLSNLAPYIKDPEPTTVLVLVYKNKKFDGRTKFARAFKKSPALHFKSKQLYDNQLPAWIKDYVKSVGLKVGDEEAHMLADFLGTDLSKVVNELGKLKLNLNKGATITKDDIEKHIGLSKDYNVFELEEALVSRDPEKAFRIINYFGSDLKTHSLIMLIAVLSSYFSKLYALRGAKITSQAAAKDVIGYYPPFIMKKHLTASRSYSAGQLAIILEILQVYDVQSKGVGVKSVSEYDLMRQMVNDILTLQRPDYDAVFYDQ